MIGKQTFSRVTILVATAFLAACGTDGAQAPAAGLAGPAFDIADLDEGPVDSITLWPIYEMYSGPLDDEAAPGPSMSLQALATQPNVRIGVVESAATVHLGATGGWTLHDRATNVQLMSGTGGSAAVTLASVSETYFRLQVMCSSVSAVNTRKAAAEAAGHETLTQFNPTANCTRLYLGKFAVAGTFGIRTTYKNNLVSVGLAPADAFWSQVTLGSAVYRVTRGSTVVNSVNPVILRPAAGSFVTIGTSATSFRRYRGTGDTQLNSAGTLAGINQLPMEQYLYGVVPRELGPIAYPEIEAQKAQAVAARTYAMVGLGKRWSDGYDLRATTSDQVYGGHQDEHPTSSGAVDATAGVVATYNGAMISTLYSSASGGHTSSNEEVYNSAPVAYLRGVPDAQRGQAFAHVPTLEVFRAHANPTSLRNTAENVFESDWSTRERWMFEWTQEEISSIVSAYAGVPVGRVHALDVTARGPSGRALTIEYVTDAGTFTDVKDHIRTSLKYISASGTLTSLPSTLIFIEPIMAQGEPTGGFRVYGGGFGHGVGMSQTGAVGMAQKGRTFDQILGHYYQGIALEHAY